MSLAELFDLAVIGPAVTLFADTGGMRFCAGARRRERALGQTGRPHGDAATTEVPTPRS